MDRGQAENTILTHSDTSSILSRLLNEKFEYKVQQILNEHIVESSFNSQSLSDALCISRMQLHRKIKALTGLSTSQFLKKKRLHIAVELLEKTDLNVSQICYAVGFNDHSYFSKCFKETYGTTPSEYTQPNTLEITV